MMTADGAAGTAVAQRSRWALPVISLVQLMIVLDATIVSIALPSAQRDLHISDANRQWVITAYVLTFGGLLLVGGRFAGVVGPRRALISGLVAFGAVSAVAGFADDEATLLIGRALQGCCAALLAPAALALLSTAFTETRERGRAFGVFAAVGAAGSAIGLLAGGLLTQYAGWRWCLFINVPIVLLALLGTPALPRDGHRPRRWVPNVPEVLLSSGGLVALVFGLSLTESRAFSDPLVLGLLAGGVLLLGAFAVLERRIADPLVPPRIVAHPGRAGAFLVVCLLQVTMFGCYLFMTYYTQAVLDYSPVRAGVALVVTTVAGAVGAVAIAGRLHGRVSTATLTVPGLVAVGAGVLVLSRAGSDESFTFLRYLLPAQILIGAGLGCVLTALTAAATAGTGAADAGVASAIFNAVQQVGAALGTALFNTVSTATTAALLVDVVPDGAGLREATVRGYSAALTVALGVVLAAAAVARLIKSTHRAQ